MPSHPKPRASAGRVLGILALVLCLLPALTLVVVVAVVARAGSSAESDIRTRADRAAGSVGSVQLVDEKDLGGNVLCLDSCREIHRSYRLERPVPLSTARSSLERWYAADSALGPLGKAWCDRSGGPGCAEVVLYLQPPRDFQGVATLRVCPEDAAAVAGNTADLPDRDVLVCELRIEET